MNDYAAPDLEFAPIDAYEAVDDTPKHTRIINETINRFNGKYALVNEDGKVVIFQFGFDNLMRRKRIDRLSIRDFNSLYMNDKITTSVDKKGNEKYAPVSTVWLNHKNRRQYINGVVFNPKSTKEDEGILNLWEGFSEKPVKGDWSLLRSHIYAIICQSDDVKFDYLMGWMARMMQLPAEQGEVAVVMKGGEGTGKGTLAKTLIKIIGQHSLAISNAKHLISNFNGHLRDAIFLFADEAFFAGDKAHVGVLKSIITEPYLTVEAKFQNATQMPNFLHIMMASNEDWVIPASVDARRFFVLEVGDEAKNNHAYFAAILDQLAAGGYGAMLHDLLTYDLTEFNVRDVPRTDGLSHQQKLSLSVPELWWKDCLERGYVYRSKLGLDDLFGVWFPMATTNLLYDSYLDFSQKRRERNPLSRETLGRFMVKMGGTPKRLRNRATGEYIHEDKNDYGTPIRTAKMIKPAMSHGYALNDLQTARDAFCEVLGLRIDWPDGEDE